MNYLKLSALLLAALPFVACNDCKEIVLEPCGTNSTPNTEHCGWSVATCYAGKISDPVAVIFDTHLNSNAPLGDDWGTTTSVPVVTAIHPGNWTANQIGQIFGIAIDEKENVYLASSDIYIHHPGQNLPIISGNLTRPFSYSAGQIFKCVPPFWSAVPFVSLPNNNDTLNGIGNIAYDRWNKQLFATNLEDGKIYRIDISTGAILETYDPWVADIGSAGIVLQAERVWGIGVNYENGLIKIYFPRVSGSLRSIYSITLNNGVFPAANSEVIEISNLPGNQEIISDLAFSSNGNELLISERGAAHNAFVNSYSRIGNWVFNRQYFVGQDLRPTWSDGGNSAGGVDFAYTEVSRNPSAKCDEYFLSTGNYMAARNSSIFPIYGIEAINYSGNLSSSTPMPTANKDTDWFIDFDGLGGTGIKGTIGDVEVFDCTECVKCSLDDY